MPRLANVVDVLAARHVKQRTETAGLRTGFAPPTFVFVVIYMPLDVYDMFITLSAVFIKKIRQTDI